MDLVVSLGWITSIVYNCWPYLNDSYNAYVYRIVQNFGGRKLMQTERHVNLPTFSLWKWSIHQSCTLPKFCAIQYRYSKVWYIFKAWYTFIIYVHHDKQDNECTPAMNPAMGKQQSISFMHTQVTFNIMNFTFFVCQPCIGVTVLGLSSCSLSNPNNILMLCTY